MPNIINFSINCQELNLINDNIITKNISHLKKEKKLWINVKSNLNFIVALMSIQNEVTFVLWITLGIYISL